MLKKTSLIIMFIVVYTVNTFAQQAKKQTVIFKGTADSKYDGEYVHIYNNYLDKRFHDSTRVQHGTFTFEVAFSESTIYSFYSGFEIKKMGGYTPLHVLIDRPSRIEIAADMENLSNSVVKGSEAQMIYKSFSDAVKPAEDKMTKNLEAKYGKELVNDPKPDTSSQKYKDLMVDYEKEMVLYNQFVSKSLEQTVHKNPLSFASMVLISHNMRTLTPDQLAVLYNGVSPKLKQGFFSDEIAQYLEGKKKSALGSFVGDFSLNDPQGKTISFYALKGKYVLIDFWGTWCGPCHKAFPELKEIYAKYHDKGFEILGIATEYTGPGPWVKDIEKEKLPWVQMIDIKGDNNISQKLFAVEQFPTTVLIDPKGKIIGRDLSPVALQKILNAL